MSTAARHERIHFFPGQRLHAEDLLALDDFHRGMRELHNRSLHQPGIGRGFGIQAARGDSVVRVGPGYALDADGREIVLTRTREEPVPPVAGDAHGETAYYDLTISYTSDGDLDPAETRRGICQPTGAVRLLEEPVFCWVPLVGAPSGPVEAGAPAAGEELQVADPTLSREIREGRRIRIARVGVRECVVEEVSVEERRNARVPEQPRIVCDRAHGLDWNLLDSGSETPLPILRSSVSTASKGFSHTPCYTARIHGPRILTLESDGRPLRVFADGLLDITESRVDGFDVAMMLFIQVSRHFDVALGHLALNTSPIAFAAAESAEEPAATDEGERLQALRRLIAPWSIEWMAVE